jgi:hypothetical protein
MQQQGRIEGQTCHLFETDFGAEQIAVENAYDLQMKMMMKMNQPYWKLEMRMQKLAIVH